jgi:P pilus assembly chaperone PapD
MLSHRLAVLGLILGIGAPSALVAQPAPPPAAEAAPAGAYLNISPRRITLDRVRRNATVTLLNQGSTPIAVDVALVDRVMLPDGQITTVEEASGRDDGRASVAALKSARDMVQISPRRATLAPGRPQTVRVRLSSPPDGVADEFRTHLTVTTLPPRETGATAEAVAAGGAASQLSFQVTAVYGLSIPVIVRPAPLETRAAIADLRLEAVDIPADGRQPARRITVAVFDIVREGQGSLFGNFEIHVAGARTGAEPLGVARGVGVYPEVARRAVRIPLTRAPNPGERLEVTFTDDDASPGKVLAKAAI